jgi:hypothetical protein
MKRSWMFVLMIVVVAVHNSAQNSVCNSSNPFLAKLRQASIDFLTSPNYQSQKCPFEWGVHGTCCDQDRLVSFANEDRTRIRNSVETYLSFVRSFRNWFRKLQSHIQEIIGSGVNISNPKVKAFFEAVKDPETQTKIEKLVEMKFKEDAERCWIQLSTIRSNSICSLCSARWSGYFSNTGDGKAWLSKDTCTLVFNVCKPSLQALVDFIELVAKINIYIRDSYKKHGVLDSADAANQLFSTIQLWNREIGVKKIKEYLNSNEPSKIQQFCGMSIQVFDKSMIEKVAKVLNQDSISKIYDLINHLKDKLDLLNNGSRLRLLQSGFTSNFGTSDLLFVGDVKVMASVDSSYSSSSGTVGASGNENSIHLAAMALNITSAFP